MVDEPSGDGGQWVTVARVAGNCGGTSSATATTGGDTRLVYRSDATQFYVFLVDQSNPDASSGFADVECRRTCADVQSLTNPAGQYQIKVVASNAPWEVLLQEYR